MTNLKQVHFGKSTYTILSAEWNSPQQVGLVQVRDDQGEYHTVEAAGLSMGEQRHAVAAWAMIREPFRCWL